MRQPSIKDQSTNKLLMSYYKKIINIYRLQWTKDPHFKASPSRQLLKP